MLSGFQEAAKSVQDKDEFAIVPFYRFYDTVHGSLDGAIRRVIERCEKAAVEDRGIKPQDVDVLKLLYLIRYVDTDIKSTLDSSQIQKWLSKEFPVKRCISTGLVASRNFW